MLPSGRSLLGAVPWATGVIAGLGLAGWGFWNFNLASGTLDPFQVFWVVGALFTGLWSAYRLYRYSLKR